MMTIDDNALQVKSRAYADERLEAVNPSMSRSTYSRHIKMASPSFNGNDIEEAYEAGYREAWNDKKEVPPEKEYYGG